MRKILSFAMVAMLLVAGCAKDVDSLNGGDTVAVTFSAKLPVEVSRTVGDGSQATVLKYAIYSTEGVLFDGYNYQDLTVQGNVATLTLDLVKGQSYKIVFWAQNAAAPYTFDRVAKTVTINYDDKELSNDEVYDAFYVMEPVTVKGPFQKQVTLRRPFAQINLGATKADVAAAKALGVEIDKSQVAFTDVPTVLNLVDGTLGEKTTNVNVTFNYNSLPGNDLTVNEVDYEYIAANYILADANTNVTNVTFAIKQGDKVINQDVTVPAVSYKRNYRTNILGRLLTSAVDFNIVIDGTPEGDLELSDEAKLILAMQTEGEYTLPNDLTLSKPLVIKEGTTFTLNLNGKTLSAESGNAIQNKGTLILKGDVVTRASGVSSVISKTTYGVNNSGILVVDGVKVNAIFNAGEVTFNDGIIENTISGKHGIYHCGSKLTINAGQFSSTSGNELIHAAVANATTINGGTFTQVGKSYLFGNGAAAIVINGGTFNGYVNDNGTNDKMRPGSAVVYGGTFNFDASAWVADGYKALQQSNGAWMVVPANVGDFTAATESTADFATAIATDNAEKTMFEWNDIYYVAEYGKVAIYPSAEATETVRGIIENSAVKEVTVTEGVTSLGNRTFRRCGSLETVVLPNSLTEIGPSAFQSCSKLTNVTIPASVQTIGDGAFSECASLTAINIPEGVTRLGQDALRATGLVSISLPASVTYIGAYAFRDCDSLSEIIINAPSFTVESTTFLNAALPVPTMTIKVANEDMKNYLNSMLDAYHKGFITVVVM